MIGETVSIRITKVSRQEVVGVLGAIEVHVLLPEISWFPTDEDYLQKHSVGSNVEVVILRYSQSRSAYIGSIRQASMEESPYIELKTKIGKILIAEFCGMNGSLDGDRCRVRVKLPNNLKATLSLPSDLVNKLQLGDVISVKVIAVDCENGRVNLKANGEE